MSQGTMAEREAVARAFIRKKKLGYTRCFIDTFGANNFQNTFAAWPDKTLVLQGNGTGRPATCVFDSERYVDSVSLEPLKLYLTTGSVPADMRATHEGLVASFRRPPLP